MWHRSIRQFVTEESAEDLIEYGLLAAFVATVAVTVLGSPAFKSGISDAIRRAVSTMVNATF